DTGVLTRRVRDELGRLAAERPELLILADSRQGLAGWPPVGFKMNAAELATLLGEVGAPTIDVVQKQARELAQRNRRAVYITMSERGVIGAEPSGEWEHVPTLPIRGPIDIVGAGDAVTANLAASLAAGANLRESLELAMAGAGVVIHQLGTTGTATRTQLADALGL
ncbi:MAG: carbohydrate kinase, partial [Verrucomicrobiales bacterium]|nr:carbohydrate kinase [Verrucomicrobiales bacterium]